MGPTPSKRASARLKNNRRMRSDSPRPLLPIKQSRRVTKPKPRKSKSNDISSNTPSPDAPIGRLRPRSITNTSPSNSPSQDTKDLNLLLATVPEEGISASRAKWMKEVDKLYAMLMMKPATSENVPQKVAFCYQMICLLFDGCQPIRTIYAMLDTGSAYTLIFESKLQEFKMRFDRQDEGIAEFYSVTNLKFKAVGKRQLFFHYKDVPGKTHCVEAYVLEAPPSDRKPTFDILLGMDHIIPSGVIRGNPAVLGGNYFVTFRPSTTGLL